MGTIKTHPAANDVFEYYNSSNLSNKPITITDSDGVAVSFSGDTLTFTVREKGSTTATWTISSGSISIGGAGYNVITLTGEHTFLAGKFYNYELYSNTDDTPIAYGVFRIIYTS